MKLRRRQWLNSETSRSRAQHLQNTRHSWASLWTGLAMALAVWKCSEQTVPAAAGSARPPWQHACAASTGLEQHARIFQAPREDCGCVAGHSEAYGRGVVMQAGFTEAWARAAQACQPR